MLKIHIGCFDSSQCMQSAYVEQKAQSKGVSGHSTWAGTQEQKGRKMPQLPLLIIHRDLCLSQSTAGCTYSGWCFRESCVLFASPNMYGGNAQEKLIFGDQALSGPGLSASSVDWGIPAYRECGVKFNQSPSVDHNLSPQLTSFLTIQKEPLRSFTGLPLSLSMHYVLRTPFLFQTFSES